MMQNVASDQDLHYLLTSQQYQNDKMKIVIPKMRSVSIRYTKTKVSTGHKGLNSTFKVSDDRSCRTDGPSLLGKIVKTIHCIEKTSTVRL